MKKYAIILIMIGLALWPEVAGAQGIAVDSCREATCAADSCCGRDSEAAQWTGGPFAGLHPGLNARFEFSLMAGLGKGRRRGVGFGESVAIDYALPLGKRGFLALGAYADHYKWGNARNTDVGVSALLGYRATGWLNIYAFAQKGFAQNASPATLYDPLYIGMPYDRPKDEIGAAFEFKLGESASLSFSVSRRTYDSPERHDIFDRPRSGLKSNVGPDW